MRRQKPSIWSMASWQTWTFIVVGSIVILGLALLTVYGS